MYQVYKEELGRILFNVPLPDQVHEQILYYAASLCQGSKHYGAGLERSGADGVGLDYLAFTREVGLDSPAFTRGVGLDYPAFIRATRSQQRAEGFKRMYRSLTE